MEVQRTNIYVEDLKGKEILLIIKAWTKFLKENIFAAGFEKIWLRKTQGKRCIREREIRGLLIDQK